MPKLSVIIPVYKAEKYLHRCVDSILAQTLDDIQIILVDDGSPDNSGKICDEYVKENNGKIVVIHKPNGGASSARNAGLEVATGEYIAFVDADDEMTDKEAYKILYEKAVDSSVEMVFCGFRQEDSEGNFDTCKVVDNEKFLEKREFLLWFANERADVGRASLLNSPFNKLYKATLLNGLRFKTNYISCNDITFNLLVYEKVNSVLLIPETPYTYFYNNGSIIRGGQNAQKSMQCTLNMIEETYSFFEKNGLSQYINCVDKFAANTVNYYVLSVLESNDKSGIKSSDIEKRHRAKYLFYLKPFKPFAFFILLLFVLRQYKLISLIYNIRGKIK